MTQIPHVCPHPQTEFLLFSELLLSLEGWHLQITTQALLASDFQLGEANERCLHEIREAGYVIPAHLPPARPWSVEAVFLTVAIAPVGQPSPPAPNFSGLL